MNCEFKTLRRYHAISQSGKQHVLRVITSYQDTHAKRLVYRLDKDTRDHFTRIYEEDGPSPTESVKAHNGMVFKASDIMDGDG